MSRCQAGVALEMNQNTHALKPNTVVVNARSIRTGLSVMSLIMSSFKTFHRVGYIFLFRNFRYSPVSSTRSRRWDRCSRSYQPSPL